MNDVCVFVPSYDGYSDIWPIAADLFTIFWPNRQWPMYWMTNGKPVPSCATPIIVPKIGRREWGSGIADALRRIPEKYVLFWVEEILLMSTLPNEIFLEAADLLRNDGTIGLVGLTRYYAKRDQPTIGSFVDAKHYDLGFTSALPALFRRYVLMHLLRSFPVSSDFEQRSHEIMKRDFSGLRSLQPARPMFRFCDNALFENRWRRCAVKHLGELGFDIDFNKRGIHWEDCRLMDGAEA